MTRALLLVALVVTVGAGPPGETPRTPKSHAFLGDMDCSSCHTPDGWKLSTSAGASGFDHDRTGFRLRGAHEATACLGCHDGRTQLARECTGCHVDDHQGRNGTACAECHRTTDWKDTRTMARHARTRMPLTGAHALLDCNACHRRTTERTWSELPSDCNACHAKDYDATTTHPNHAHPTDPVTHAPLPAFPRTCAQCHDTVMWSSAIVSTMTSALSAPADHDTRFAITTGKHRGAPCESCHVDLAHPARVACTGCHAHDTVALVRQHRTIATGAAASACLACHPGGLAR